MKRFEKVTCSGTELITPRSCAGCACAMIELVPEMRRFWSRVVFKGDHHMVMHRRNPVCWLWIITPVDQLGGGRLATVDYCNFPQRFALCQTPASLVPHDNSGQ